MNPRAFTIEVKRSNFIQLVTPCDISLSYNPDNSVNLPHPQFKRFNSLWDTGASVSVISDSIVN
ncbi:MAG: hypothetical protein IK042_04945, partial [Bacteroidales bacterium]|nr:hypothetical protein [Bacteroidales bacterium]